MMIVLYIIIGLVFLFLLTRKKGTRGTVADVTSDPDLPGGLTLPGSALGLETSVTYGMPD